MQSWEWVEKQINKVRSQRHCARWDFWKPDVTFWPVSTATLNSYRRVCAVASYDKHKYITITSFSFMQNFPDHKPESFGFVLWLFMKCHLKAVTLLHSQATCRKLRWISLLKGAVVMAHGTPFIVPKQVFHTIKPTRLTMSSYIAMISILSMKEAKPSCSPV